MTTTTARSRLDPDELAALEEQRDFLLRSLDDLELEKQAGDIDDHDYRALKDDYTARAAEVLRALDEQRHAFAQARRPRRRGRLAAAGAAVLVVAIAAGLLVAQSSGQRKPGDTISGGVTTSPGQPRAAGGGVQECITTFQGQQPVEGIKCFDKLIKANPADGSAYTYRGWLLWNVGHQGGQAELVASAKGDLAKAVQVEPKLVDPHIFLAIIANREGDNAAAQAELNRVDALGGPPPGMEPLLNQLRTSVAAGNGPTTVGPATTPSTAAATTPTTGQ